MKIVQINSTCGIGSNGRLSLQIAEYVQDKGHESYFFYANGLASVNYSYKISGFIDRKLHALLSRIFGLQGYFSTRSTKRLVNKLKVICPDVVHVHNLHSNYINLGVLFDYIANNNVGLVLTLHDCWYFTGKCVHPIYSNCQKFKGICGNCPQLKSDKTNPTFFFDTTHKCQKDKKRWFSLIAKEKLCVVGVSEWITNEAKQSSVLCGCNFTTIFNWVDQTKFRYNRKTETEVKYGISPNKKIILMVSSELSEHKGFMELCELSQLLSNDYQIVFVGNKGGLTLPNNVTHIQHTNSVDELSNIYSVASVCVNLTHGETFGLVTLEALSCGTPTIVYNNTASPELVSSEFGFVANEKDGILPIKAAIDNICSKGKDFYIEKCMNYARSKFSKEVSLNKYLEVYKDVCNKK